MQDNEFYHEAAAPITNVSYESNGNVYETNGATSEMNDDTEQSHPPLKDLSKNEYSYFNDIENFPSRPSYWRLNEIPERHPGNEHHAAPKKRRKRNAVMRPLFRWSESEIESEDDTNWTYKPLNPALWNAEDNILPQYRKNAFKEIKPNFFDHYELAPNLMTWGKNAGRLRRLQRTLDLLDTSDYASGEQDQSVSTGFKFRLEFLHYKIRFETVNTNVFAYLQSDNNNKSNSANASSSNSFDDAPVLDPMADGPPESEVQNISLNYYLYAPQEVRFK